MQHSYVNSSWLGEQASASSEEDEGQPPALPARKPVVGGKGVLSQYIDRSGAQMGPPDRINLDFVPPNRISSTSQLHNKTSDHPDPPCVPIKTRCPPCEPTKLRVSPSEPPDRPSETTWEKDLQSIAPHRRSMHETPDKISPVKPLLLDYEKMRERELELERIHRRSRELMSWPHGLIGEKREPYIKHRSLSPRLRKRVQSPAKDDYRDFARPREPGRDLMSPCRDDAEDATWNLHCHCSTGLEDRLMVLEEEKTRLTQQVARLSSLLHQHTQKVASLEHVVEGKQEALLETEERVQQELVNRSSLETSKLTLLCEISSMRLRQTEMASENRELRRRLDIQDNDISLNGIVNQNNGRVKRGDYNDICIRNSTENKCVNGGNYSGGELKVLESSNIIPSNKGISRETTNLPNNGSEKECIKIPIREKQTRTSQAIADGKTKTKQPWCLQKILCRLSVDSPFRPINYSTNIRPVTD